MQLPFSMEQRIRRDCDVLRESQLGFSRFARKALHSRKEELQGDRWFS